MTSRRRCQARSIGAVLVLLGMALAACGSGGDTSDSPGASDQVEVSDNGGSTSPVTDDTVDPAVAAEIESLLASSPVFVEPDVDLDVTASAPITAATGGEVSLDLGGGTTVVLRLPAGALPADDTVTLRAVTGLDGTPAIGVQIEPSGLDFTPGALPTLTITGMPPTFADAHAFIVDRDGVVDRADWLPVAENVVEVLLPHFSDLFFTDDIASIPSTPLDTAIERARDLIDAADMEVNRAVATDIMSQVYDTFLVPLLKAAAKRCSGYDAIKVALRWTEWVQRLELTDLDSMAFNPLAKAVLVKEMQCAINDCEVSGGRDHTALARYLKALATGEQLGVWSEDESTEYVAGAREAMACWVHEVRITGTARLTGYDITLTDRFSAHGQVWQDDQKQCYLGDLISWCEGPRRRTIPMKVTYQGNLQVFINELFSPFRDTQYDVGTCSEISPYPPSAAEITLIPVAAANPADPPQLTIWFRPYLAPTTITCTKRSAQWPLVYALQMMKELQPMPVGEFGFGHEFDNATEYQPVRTWRYHYANSINDGRSTLYFELHVSVWSPRNIEVPSVPSTAGMIDVANSDLTPSG